MEIVIKIPEDSYKATCVGCMLPSDVENVVQAIKNGTPLPKGHGRLIDVNDLLDDINLEDNDYNRDINTGEIITLENIDRIPTIIGADGGGEDDLKT